MKKTTNNNSYNGYTINSDIDKKCYIQSLDAYLAHLTDMTKKHDKVFQVRFDIHYPQSMDSSALPKNHLSKLVNRVTQDINRNYKLPEEGRCRSSGKNSGKHNPDPRILLAREQHGGSHNPHIHGLLLVNGNAFHHPSSLIQRIERQLQNVLGVDDVSGLVHYANQNGPGCYMLKRNDPDFNQKLNEASHHGSYLHKTRGKENLPKGQWSLLGTRAPKTTSHNSQEI